MFRPGFVIQRLAAVPGRKNLVLLLGQPHVPPALMAMARSANIALYPVLVRRLGAFQAQDEARAIAARTGGEAFFDAMDLSFAVRAAEEDSSAAYVPGILSFPVDAGWEIPQGRGEARRAEAALRGAFDIALRIPGVPTPRMGTVQVKIPEARLAQALESGYTVTVSRIDAQPGEVEVAALDRANGASGSLRIPVPKN
jgi:hypothetical protein